MKPFTSLICAMSRNHVIGIKNDLPWHLPLDLQHFKKLTQNKPIIMGRLTLQSILDRRDGKPLPHRPHYVITRTNPSTLPEGVQAFTSLEEGVKAARADYPDTEIMIIGGASIYAQSVTLVDRMYLTIIDREIEGDAVFPIYNREDWMVSEREEASDGDIQLSFLTLDRKQI